MNIHIYLSLQKFTCEVICPSFVCYGPSLCVILSDNQPLGAICAALTAISTAFSAFK